MTAIWWRRSMALLTLALWLCRCAGDSEVAAVSDTGEDTAEVTDHLLDVTDDVLDEEVSEERPEIVIPGGDVARLFEVVNSSDYEGYRVVLEPGTYDLERSLDPTGLGYLRLQRDMELVGTNEYRDYEDPQGNAVPDGIWDPWDAAVDGEQFPNSESETLIDCTRMYANAVFISNCAPDPTTGRLIPAPSCIALDHGSSVRQVTVRGSRWAYGSLVQYRPAGPDATASADEGRSGEISDCVVDGGDYAVSAGLAGCPAAGLEAGVTIARNVVRNANTTGVFLSAGLLTQDVTLQVTLRDNRIEGNHLFGVITYAGASADRCELEVSSSNNISRHNDVGGAFLVSFVDYPYVAPPGGVDNRLSWTSKGDWIIGNGLPDEQDSAGGVTVGAAYLHGTTLSEVTRNSAEVRLFDTTFASGGERENLAGKIGRADVTAVGHSGPRPSEVDPNSTVILQLEGCRSDGTPVYFDHSHPDDPNATSRVTIEGGAESLAGNNEGIPGAVEVDYGDF